ncbi:PAS domain S-box protein [Geovibrio thiophilus]|nr:PAS domain S-box protein [Geovibrio thiophilus]
MAIFMFTALTVVHVRNDLSSAIDYKHKKIEFMLSYQSDQLERSLRSRFRALLSDYYLREAMASKDRERIRLYFNEKYGALVAEYHTEIIIHIHDENGSSFMRMHAPGHLNYSGYPRPMLEEVADKKEPRFGFDLGCYGLHYRYAEPVYYMGVFVGIAEVGIGVDYLLSLMKNTLDLEMGLFIPADKAENLCFEPRAESLDGERLINVSNDDFVTIFNKADFSKGVLTEINEDGKFYRVHMDHFLKGYNGQKIASLVTFQDITNEKMAITHYLRLAVIMAVIFICLTILMMKNSFMRIISDLEKKYKESKSRENYLGDIIANSLNEIFIYDIDTLRFVEVNRGACKNLGYSHEEILQMTTLDIKPQMTFQSFRKQILPVIEGEKETVMFETVHRRKDGTLYPVEIHIQKTFVEGREVIMAVVLDITQRKDAENRLKALNEALEKKVDQETERRLFSEKIMMEQKKFIDMGQMINAVAHQWRQPLNALGLYVQDMRETHFSQGLDDSYVNQIEKDCMHIINHMSDTIDDFRRFFAPDKSSAPFEIIRSVLETIRLVSAQLMASSIDYRIICRCGDDSYFSENSVESPGCLSRKTLVRGYEGEFKQVMLNIIHNARDAIIERRQSEAEGFQGFIEFDLDACGDNIVLSIKDNGGGIPENVIQKVFDPYFTTKEEGKGTGIGLYMSKNIVEQHMKGYLTAESKDGCAVFRLVLRSAAVKDDG